MGVRSDPSHTDVHAAEAARKQAFDFVAPSCRPLFQSLSFVFLFSSLSLSDLLFSVCLLFSILPPSPLSSLSCLRFGPITVK